MNRYTESTKKKCPFYAESFYCCVVSVLSNHLMETIETCNKTLQVYTVPGTVLDGDLGLEVISFDDPVNNKIPSANLVNGEYLSSTDNSLLPLVNNLISLVYQNIIDFFFQGKGWHNGKARFDHWKDNKFNHCN